MKYIPLNIKTEFDLMNSLIKIDELISYAKNNSINSLGITDSNMFGCYEFITKCNKNDIKPIIGTELNIKDINLILYASNYDGYISLCKIVSKKNTDDITLEDVYNNANNIICVCNYKDYELLKNKFTHVFIKYANEQEKTNALILTQDVVFMKEIKYFNKEDKQ